MRIAASGSKAIVPFQVHDYGAVVSNGLKPAKNRFTKGQLISDAWDHFLWKIRFSKKTNEPHLTIQSNNSSSQKKANWFVHFFGESTAWQFAFDINWPLDVILQKISTCFHQIYIISVSGDCICLTFNFQDFSIILFELVLTWKIK